MRLARPLLFFSFALCLAGSVFGQSQPPLSQRVVAYDIDAKYNPTNHTVDGVETLTYRNLTGKPLDRFPFHLYLNAFQQRSTFNEEMRRQQAGSRFSYTPWNQKDYGANDIARFDMVSMSDGKKTLTFPQPQNLMDKMKFVAPDDGNVNDKTVLEVQLPQPIPPGGEVTFRIGFKATFPEVVARTGYFRDFLLAGQWFPKVGVWWQGAWNCHQFHRNTEFFADFGTYNVNITLPDRFVVGATGVLTSEKKNPDGTKTLAFHADDVIDFAWTADPNYKVVEDSYTNSAGGVTKIKLLMQPGHMEQVARHMGAVKGTLKKFDQWYGPYPYPSITVVDPTHGAGRAGGMEYPMFITAGTSWYMPNGLRVPELVTEHEFGHQYFYAIIATNEFEDAWLDEGINSYAEVKAMNALYGRNSILDLPHLGMTGGERGYQRMAYSGAADVDPMWRYGWQYLSNGSYGAITYGKTATVLLTLEGIIGEDKVQQAVRLWYQRYKFTHPTREDFLNTVNEVAGQDLTWFWDQAVKGTNILDYRVLSVNSMRNDWNSGKFSKSKKGETPYEDSVVVHRKGDFIMPVQLEVKFDNGEVAHETWDGKDRWHRFTWNKKAQIVSAEIDYTHQLQLDKDQYNNSYVVDADKSATRKITAYWMVAVQWLGQMLAWLT